MEYLGFRPMVCSLADTELGKQERVLSLVEIPEALAGHGGQGDMGGALEDKMVCVKKVGAVLWVLWHGGKALKGEEGGAGPFPATTGQFSQSAVQ